MADDTATIHTDGAARGNPGPAAYAYVIDRPGRAPLEHAERLGTATNNVAEYTALVRALQRAAELGLRRAAVFSDSELMVKQMNGEYSVKNADLKELYDEAQGLRRRFDAVTLAHVRRAENRRADRLCNDALDGRALGGPPPAPPARRKAGKKAAPARRPQVDEQAVACLRTASAAWSRADPRAPTPEEVWEQLWSVLQEGGVLKPHRAQ
jgi:ribonuclease HI